MVKKQSIAFDWLDRANKSIAHGALTNSKRPSCFVNGVYPTHLTRGHGAYVWDVDNKRYIDFICGLGSNLLGYAHEEVNQAIVEQAKNGTTLSLSSRLEIETAEKAKEMFPWIEKVRFLKTGSEACAAALRIARAYSKKKYVVSQGYHGWHDEFTSLTPPCHGVNEQSYISKGWDRDGLSTGAVIVEPIITDYSATRFKELHELKDKCEREDAVLIFDEVITGFRFPKYSVAAHIGLEPNLICLGKALANGMPLAIVAGKSEIMECANEYFVSSTFAGETLSLAAALKTMTLLQTKYSVQDLWAKGQYFLNEFNSIWPDGVWIEGYPTRGVFKGSDLNKALFWQESVKAGILFGPSWFFNFPLMELTSFVLSTSKDIMNRIKTGSIRLEGELPKAPFAQKARQ